MANSTAEVAARSLQHLPEPVRARLLGPGGDGQGGLVGEVLDDVLRNIERSARAPFLQPERRQALLRSMTRALGLALHQWRPASPTSEELEPLRAWMRERFVSQQLLLLLQPHEGARWDVARLREEWQACALDAERLGQADVEAWLRLLVAGFYRGVAEEPSLHEVIPLPSLRQLAEGLGARLAMPGEGDELTARSEYIRQLVHRIRQGEDLHEKLLEEIQELLKTADSWGHVQQQALYQVAENALGRVGLAAGQENGRRERLAKAEPEGAADIRSFLEELRRKLETRHVGQGSESELADMETLYQRNLRDTFEHLTFRGISETGQAVRLPLEEVYVDLKVVAEVPGISDESSAAERRLLQEGDRRGRLEADQERELDGLRYHRWKEEARREQTRLQRKVLDTSGTALSLPAMVILGDPGSGKTTLLHYLALRAIRPHSPDAPKAVEPVAQVGVLQRGRLPIFIPLAAYDDYVRNVARGCTLEQFLALYYAQRKNLPGLEPLFQRALEEGRALILLDGLDEVLDLTMRRFVAQQVSGLMGRWAERGNRFVLTSRVIGYREVALSGSLPHFMVLDFQREEIQRFAHKWCEAFETWAVSGRRSDVALRRARQQAQDLLADVYSKPSVAHLASNPLLLTTLALLRRQVGQLPSRRIELYERYVRALLDHREVNRSEGARQQAPERLAPNIALQHLMDLALWLQRHRPSGTARERDMVRAMTESALRREEKAPDRVSPREWEEAELRAARCLREVRDIAGLIGERGNDAYGFLHLTFQEYLVGRALARESPERRWEVLLPHLHDPRWREPLLLCAGQLGVVELREDLVSNLVERILETASEHESQLHRDLFLAMAVVADDVVRAEKTLSELLVRLDALRGNPVPQVRRQAWEGLARLVKLGHVPTQERFFGWLDERAHLTNALSALADISLDEVSVELRGRVLEHLEDEDSEVRSKAADALGTLSGSDTAVREAFLRRLEGTDPWVRTITVGALGALSGSDAAVREALLRCLEDVDFGVRSEAVGALGALSGSDAAVREALLRRLEDAKFEVRAAAVGALGALSGSDAAVREALLRRLEDADSRVRSKAVGALGALSGSDAAVRGALLRRLEDADSRVRSEAVGALGAVAGSDAAVRKALLRRLEDANYWVRSKAAGALGALSGSDTAVREALLRCLDDANSEMRADAVGALGSLSGSDAAVCEALLRRLEDVDPWVRSKAAGALGALSGGDAAVREALLRRLEDEDSGVSAAAAGALGGLAGSDAAVREALLRGLEGVALSVRAGATNVLGVLSGSDAAVREAFLLLLEDEDSEVRAGAVSALGVLSGSDAAVREALLRRLEDEDSKVRAGAVGALGALSGGDVAVREALLRLLEDEDSEVRARAVGALGVLSGSDAAVREALLRRLEDEDSEVRAAAAGALSALPGSDAAVREALLCCLEDANPEMQAVAAGALGAVAGSDAAVREALLLRLEGADSGVRAAAASALGALPGSDAAVREALLRCLEDADSGVLLGAVGALGALSGSDAAVREALLRRLEDGNFGVRAVAVGALGALFGSDTAVREALLRRLEDSNAWVRSEAAGALGALSGSDAAVREALLLRLEDLDSRVRSKAASALGALSGSDVAVREALLLRLEDANPELRAEAVGALGVLSGSDAEVRGALLLRLEDANSKVRAEAVGALGAVVGSDAEVRRALLKSEEDEAWEVRIVATKVISDSAEGWHKEDERFLPWLGTVTAPYKGGLAKELRGSLIRRVALNAAHDERLQERLLEMLRHPEWRMRSGAALALVAIPGGPPRRARVGLLGLLDDLRDEGNWPHRLTVAQVLLNVRDRTTSERAIHCTMRALDYGIEPWYDRPVTGRVRQQAAEILGRLEPTYRNERILQRLLRLLQEDSEGDVRDAAYQAALRLIAAPSERAHVSRVVAPPKLAKTTASLVHLSDLHFNTDEEADVWYSQLAQDLRTELECHQLDGVILSGDITNKSVQAGYDAALRFLEKLCQEFKVPSQRVVLVPGNHDLCRAASESAYRPYKLKPGESPPREGAYIPVKDRFIEVPDEGEYKKRFERFARFYEQVRGEAYPLDYAEQGVLYHFPEVNLLVLGLNSAWNLDHHFTSRAGIHERALTQPLERLRQDDQYRQCLKLAVWHHPLEGPGDDRIKDHGFLERLVGAGFRLGLHGHIHKAETRLYRYGHDVGGRRMEIISAGTFGAPTHEWVSGYPLQYSLLQFQGKQLTTQTRRREERNGTWKPDARWGDRNPKPFYTISLD